VDALGSSEEAHLRARAKGRPAARKRRRAEALLALLYLFPATLVLLTFHLLPIFYAFFISLHQWDIIPEGFVGFGNYLELARDERFWRSLVTTVWYALLTVPLSLFLGLVVAWLLFQKLRAKGLYRTLYFLPYVTSVVAAAFVWGWIFNDNYGFANLVLTKLHLPALRWLLEPTGVFDLAFRGLGVKLPAWAGGPSLALVAVVVLSVWSSIGFNMILFLAGLGSIPKELLEAARLDGASERAVFRHVTWPLLSPTTFFLLIVSTIRTFQAFSQIYAMTGGADGPPLGTTQTITLYLYWNLNSQTRLGYGSAVAFALFAIILALTAVQFRLGKERVVFQ
jgi:multiple sugar transport system permease protein